MSKATPIVRSDPAPQYVEFGATQADHFRRFDRRDERESIVSMARLLPEAERLLIQWKYRDGLTNVKIADRLGLPSTKIGATINRLVRHISSPEYRLYLYHRDMIPPNRRELARLVLCEFKTQKSIAQTKGVYQREIRRQWAEVRLLARLLPLVEIEARRLVGLALKGGAA